MGMSSNLNPPRQDLVPRRVGRPGSLPPFADEGLAGGKRVIGLPPPGTAPSSPA